MPHNFKFLAPEPINLVNNESTSDDDENLGPSLHFGNVTVGDCTIVNSEKNKFTVWQIEFTVSPAKPSERGCPKIHVYKRYTDFVVFREQLLRRLPPDMAANVPELPPKVSWYDSWRYEDANFKSSWLARRRAGLELFLNQLLLNDRLLGAALGLVKSFLEN
ncbi:LAME_0D02410g1_1 [Lachancea meyersii CBS 8951]|uniref:Endosomal/vacuolar adapter protein YPT35 n=1 Tax=Lachancea meyersii CBS 8951 TaxID=1266667 RepID=A0A1G4J772_9SACH|nr:LAME_0D02410g1_1 [Lachancea meyersii CBS 8951]